jgi:hypothetical protein
MRRFQKWKNTRLNDMPGRPNCTQCSIAALSDEDKVSVWVRKSQSEPEGANRDALEKDLERAGLRHPATDERGPGTDPRQDFPQEEQVIRLAVEAIKRPPGAPRPEYDYVARGEDYMRESNSNTFVIAVTSFDGKNLGSHTIIAVKGPDGSITYMDFQTQPPMVATHLDPKIFSVTVVPTDIDWRFNRQLYSMYENAPHLPTMEFTNPSPRPSR